MTVTMDRWPERQAQLEAEGWLFYDVRRYDPTVVRGYTTEFLGGSPATRRKANRPLYLILQRTTANAADPWAGTLRLGNTSSVSAWVPGAVMPPDDADWAVGTGAHYMQDGSLNPVVEAELDEARDSPAASVSRQYGNCSDPDTALAAIRDLFSRISV